MKKAVRNFVSTACKILPDKTYLKLRYYLTFRQRLNLKNPQSYNEKLQWIKLYDRNPLYPTIVDKYDVKQYLEPIIGKEHIIPTLGIWDSADAIDFDSLPAQFVLKCTHDSGSIVICQDKQTFDAEAAKKSLAKHLRHNFYYGGREWPYKNLKRRIIAEPLLKDDHCEGLNDYKFFCFGGKMKLMLLATDRNVPGKEVRFDYYDADFRHLNLTRGHPMSGTVLQDTRGFAEMKRMAESMAQGFRHVRVDFYYVNGTIYFGEYTLFPACGFKLWEPYEWNNILGSWIDLNP